MYSVLHGIYTEIKENTKKRVIFSTMLSKYGKKLWGVTTQLWVSYIHIFDVCVWMYKACWIDKRILSDQHSLYMAQTLVFVQLFQWNVNYCC